MSSLIRTEAQLQSSVIDNLRGLGFDLIYHTHDSRRSEEGFPDILAINTRRGLLWVAEMKGPKTPVLEGRLRGRGNNQRWHPGQQEWLDGFTAVRRVIVPGIVRPDDYLRVMGHLDDAALRGIFR